MKKIFIIALFLLTIIPATMAQLQLSNPGFENWEASGSQAKPNGWSSFPQSDGSWAWAARTAQHYHRNGGRPGTDGSSYVTIYSRSVMGVVANGNITTGQVHAGSTNASSSENYNYSHRGSYAHPFTGTPDSMYVWVSYYAANSSSLGSVRAFVHGDMDFRDPTHCSIPADYNCYAVAQFTRTTSSNSTPSWEQKRVAFTHDGTSSANYILVTIATNATPGSGSAGDSLSIDDIEFIYSAWMDSLSVNGTSIADFQRDSFDYSVTLSTANDLRQAILDYATQASDATVDIDTLWVTNYEVRYTLHVTAEDTLTTRTYTVTLTAPDPVCNSATDFQCQVVDNSAYLTWTPGEGNLSWEVFYASQDLGFDSAILLSASTPVLMLSNLDYDQTYTAYLRSVCADSMYTDWDQIVNFTTPVPPIYECLPADSIVATLASHDSLVLNPYQIRWFDSIDSAIYQLQIVAGADTLADTILCDKEYAFLPLSWNTTHIVKVRVLCDTANMSSWVVTTFTTDPEPVVSISQAQHTVLGIYPNPARDIIVLQADGPVADIAIYDVYGRQVLTQANPDNTVSIAHLSNGTYVLRATLNDGTATLSRFVKVQ